MLSFGDLKKQQNRIQEMIDQVDAMFTQRDSAYNGDLASYTFVGEVEFLQESNEAQDIVFQVPEGCDFVARRMSLFPSFRFYTTDTATNGPNETSFRPCILTSTIGGFPANLQSDRAAVDAFLFLSESYRRGGREVSRALQNMPFPAQFMYSSPINYRSGNAVAVGAVPTYYPSFQFPSAMVFPEDYLLPAGSSLTCRVAPSFAGVRSEANEPGGDTTLQNEYRITVTLEGHKRVRR